MSNPVTEYLQQYGGKNQEGGDPVQQYLQQYGGGAEEGEEPFDIGEEPPPGGYPLAEAGPNTDRGAIQGLRDLLERDDITPEQRTRITRLIQTQMASMAEDEKRGDPIVEQFRRAAKQQALHFPAGVLRLASHLPLVGGAAGKAATGLEETIEGIEPTVGSEHPYLQAGAQALGAVTGETASAIPGFKASEVVAKGALGVAGRVAPKVVTAAARGLVEKAATRLPGAIEKGAGAAIWKAGTELGPRYGAKLIAQQEELAARIAQTLGKEYIGNMVRAAPKELLAATIFQGLTDPESLKTPEGITMALMFSILGSAGEGVRVTKMAKAEIKAKKAKDFVDEAVAKDAADKEVARIAAQAAEAQAQAIARETAAKLWANGTHESRHDLMPEWTKEDAQTSWRNLTKEQKEQVIAKIRESTRDSNLNKGMDTGVEPTESGPPPPPTLAGEGTPPPTPGAPSSVTVPTATGADPLLEIAREAVQKGEAMPTAASLQSRLQIPYARARALADELQGKGKKPPTPPAEPPATPPPEGGAPPTAPSPTELPSGEPAPPAPTPAPAPKPAAPAGRPPEAKQYTMRLAGNGKDWFVMEGEKVLHVITEGKAAAVKWIQERQMAEAKGQKTAPATPPAEAPKAPAPKPAEPAAAPAAPKPAGPTGDPLVDAYQAGDIVLNGEISPALQALNRIGEGLEPAQVRAVAAKIKEITDKAQLSTKERNAKINSVIEKAKKDLAKKGKAPKAKAAEVAPAGTPVTPAAPSAKPEPLPGAEAGVGVAHKAPAAVADIVEALKKDMTPEEHKAMAQRIADMDQATQDLLGEYLNDIERRAIREGNKGELSQILKNDAYIQDHLEETPAAAPEPVQPPAAKPGEVDDQVATLMAQLAQEKEARGHAERRAHAAEREAQVDRMGIQSGKAWDDAKTRVEADPDKRIVFFDLKQFKAFNDTKGQTAGDELLRSLGNAINGVLKPGEQAFRVGGDEFIIVTSAAEAEGVAARMARAFPDRPVEGTPYTMGLRHAIGSTFKDAEQGALKVKEGETAPKLRVVEKTTESLLTPQAETVGEPQIGEKPSKAKKAKKPAAEKKPKEGGRTNADIKADIAKLDARLKAEDISNAEYVTKFHELRQEQEALKAKTEKAKAEKKAKAGEAEPKTRATAEVAVAAEKTMEQLKAEEADIAARMAATSNPEELVALTHQDHLIQREIRMKKPLVKMDDPTLDAHAAEVKKIWDEADADGKAKLEQRVVDIEREYEKRKRPSLNSFIRDESGVLYGASDPLEIEPGSMTSYEKEIQDLILVDPAGARTFPSIHDLFLRSWKATKHAYRHIVRGTLAADEAGKQLKLEKEPAIRNPGIWAELLPGWAGRAQRMLENGPFRITDQGEIFESGTRGLSQILEPFKGRLNEVRRYMTAEAVVKRAELNKESGPQIAAAVRVMQNTAPDVAQASREATQFMAQVYHYLADAGSFSPTTLRALMVLDQFHVPIQFYVDGSPAAVLQELAQRLKIIDPLRTIVDKTRRFTATADRNRLGKILADAADANPKAAEGLIWQDPHIKTTIDPVTIAQAELIQRGAAKHGMKISKEVATDIALGLREKYIHEKNQTIPIWRNGKREVWHVSPELAAMYKSFQPAEMHFIVRALGFVPQIAKVGITDNPAFAFVNAVRDTWVASLQSQYGFVFGYDSIKGFYHAVKNTEFAQERRAAAGTAGGITGRAVESTEASYRSILPKTPYEAVRERVFHPIQAMRELSIPFEEAARLGEYIRARGAGASAMDAAIASQRVTVNFRQRGLSMQGLNHVVIFLNPAIQSIDASARAVVRGVKEPKKHGMRMALYGLGAITLPSIYLWAANKNDKKIQELRKSRFGSSYWYVRANDNTIIKVPKPFLMGAMMGTLWEDVLDSHYDKDPTSGERFIESLVQQIPYNLVPTAMNLTLGLITNRDFGTGAPIAPDRLEQGDGQVAPWLRARPETGPTARQLGEMANISPAKIEFAIRNVLGSTGTGVLWAIDQVNDAKDKYPASVASDIPVIGRFIARYPTQGAFNLRRFYDNAKKHEEVINSMHALEKAGDILKLKEFIAANKPEIALAKVYSQTRKELADLRAATESFAVLPEETMSPKEKRARMNKIVETMIDKARTINGIVDRVQPPLRERYKGGVQIAPAESPRPNPAAPSSVRVQ